MSATAEDFLAIDGFGKIMAESLYEFLNLPETKELVEKFKEENNYCVQYLNGETLEKPVIDDKDLFRMEVSYKALDLYYDYLYEELYHLFNSEKLDLHIFRNNKKAVAFATAFLFISF